MARRLSLQHTLVACFAAVAVIPTIAMLQWNYGDMTSAADLIACLVIVGSGLVAALGFGWMLSRRIAREQEENRRRQQELAQAMRSAIMSEMANAIAHEINQPLAAIAAYVEGCLVRLAEGERPTREVLDALEKAAEQARRAGMVLRRVRGFVREAAPGRPLIDLNVPVREAAALIASEVRLAGAELVVDIPQSELPVHADSIQIQQMILSLSRDGLHGMANEAPQGRRIRIATRRAADGARLEIVTTDAAAGAAPDLRALDPFFATEQDSRALGLSMCRAIAEAHDGELSVDHPADGGARFALTLPLAGPTNG